MYDSKLECKIVDNVSRHIAYAVLIRIKTKKVDLKY